MRTFCPFDIFNADLTISVADEGLILITWFTAKVGIKIIVNIPSAWIVVVSIFNCRRAKDMT
ncbi:hypothetical protein VLG3_10340 [Lactobacillus gasseri]|jgi:hypothetical protein